MIGSLALPKEDSRRGVDSHTNGYSWSAARSLVVQLTPRGAHPEHQHETVFFRRQAPSDLVCKHGGGNPAARREDTRRTCWWRLPVVQVVVILSADCYASARRNTKWSFFMQNRFNLPCDFTALCHLSIFFFLTVMSIAEKHRWEHFEINITI